MKKTKHLVTGGTGFIGSALVRKLVDDGHEVRVFDNGLRGTTENLSSVLSSIEMIRGDIRDAQAVHDAVTGCESVWHLAAVNGTENFYKKPGMVLEVGAKGIANILDACKLKQVKNIFVMSSSEVYQTPPRIPTDEAVPLVIPDPMNARYSYGASKVISEMMALHCEKNEDSRIVVIRPHNVYGPAMGWEHVVPQLISKVSALLNGKNEIRVPIQGTGNETRAYCYITDMIDGLMAVYRKGKDREIYHVGNPVETTVISLVNEIASVFGVKAKVQPGVLTAGSTTRRCPNIEKLLGLGFTPKVSLTEGIRLTAEWYSKSIQGMKERKAA